MIPQLRVYIAKLTPPQGAGVTANNLKLGCDCLGAIYYLSSTLSTPSGTPLPPENVVCIHEQDAGIGFKHTNYRTGRATVTRSRELVLQTIITVSNYDYILAYFFNQSGDFTYEVRATGILSTVAIDPALTSSPYGTALHPGVTREQVVAATGWAIRFADQVTTSAVTSAAVGLPGRPSHGLPAT